MDSEITPAPGPVIANPAATTAQSVARLQQAIQARSQTDRSFISWYLYFFLLSWITFGLATLYYFYRRMSRLDAYSRRKIAYYEALVEFTERRADIAGNPAPTRVLTDQMRRDVSDASGSSLKPIGAALNFVLAIVTFGIWAWVVIYKVNRAWDDRQRFEAKFDDMLSQSWLQLGLLTHPITFKVDEGKSRNFWLWLVLSVVTFGIWYLVWDYRLYTDPERLYPEIHSVEDAVLQIARTS